MIDKNNEVLIEVIEETLLKNVSGGLRTETCTVIGMPEIETCAFELPDPAPTSPICM